jgi:hypothetical protein
VGSTASGKPDSNRRDGWTDRRARRRSVERTTEHGRRVGGGANSPPVTLTEYSTGPLLLSKPRVCGQGGLYLRKGANFRYFAFSETELPVFGVLGNSVASR